MTFGQIISLLETLEASLGALASAGVSVADLLEKLQTARAEGRALSDEELDAFARGAAEAIAKL